MSLQIRQLQHIQKADGLQKLLLKITEIGQIRLPLFPMKEMSMSLTRKRDY